MLGLSDEKIRSLLASCEIKPLMHKFSGRKPRIRMAYGAYYCFDHNYCGAGLSPINSFVCYQANKALGYEINQSKVALGGYGRDL